MKREIRNTRNELMMKSKALRTAPFDEECKDTDKEKFIKSGTSMIN